MCKFCEEGKPILITTYNSIGINGKALILLNEWKPFESDTPQTFGGMKDINYCPMCGKRLEKKKLV